MRKVTKSIIVLAALALSFSAAACSKAPAEAAVKAAEQALATAQPELEKYVPEQFGSLSQAVKDARAWFDQGKYTEALNAARELPDKIAAAVEAAKAKKADLTEAFSEIEASLPGLLDRLKSKLAELAAMKRLPKGIDKAMVASAQSELDTIGQAWTETMGAFEEDEIPKAVEAARGLKDKAEALASSLGLAPAAPAAGE